MKLFEVCRTTAQLINYFVLNIKLMKITKNEERLIHPHKYYGFKSGMYVIHDRVKYLFMGYVNSKECVLSDIHGNKFITFITFLQKIN
jgi:hypothetical protein